MQCTMSLNEEEDDAQAVAFELTVEPLLLPPPLLAPIGLGPLPPDVLRRVAFFLDHVSLCRVDSAASGCRHSREDEGEIWARLCALHFPAMCTSVLGVDTRSSTGRSSRSDTGARGRRGGRRRGENTGGSGGGRTPWWRDGTRGKRRELSPGGALSPGASPLASPAYVPGQSPELGPWPSESPELWPILGEAWGSPSLEEETGDIGEADVDVPCRGASAPAVTQPLSPAASPSSPPESTPTSSYASPPASPAALLDGTAGAATLLVDWRTLYAKRWLKKKGWDAARQPVGRERAGSGLSEASTGVAASSSTCADDAGVRNSRRVSELSRRELNRLSEAAHRLKICTLCGEKFSPGEARMEPTACCFHPGEFAPAETRGWTRNELKQLMQYARFALKSAGGASWVKRHPRASRGHGHWLRGLGVLSSSKDKYRHCLEGKVPSIWTCCSGDGIFAEGCQRGRHRSF